MEQLDQEFSDENEEVTEELKASVYEAFDGPAIVRNSVKTGTAFAKDNVTLLIDRNCKGLGRAVRSDPPCAEEISEDDEEVSDELKESIYNEFDYPQAKKACRIEQESMGHKQKMHNTGRFEREFIVDRTLGKGEYGIVYKVKCRDWPEIKYAVKRIRLDFDCSSVSRVIDEANKLSMLAHPGIASNSSVWIEKIEGDFNMKSEDFNSALNSFNSSEHDWKTARSNYDYLSAPSKIGYGLFIKMELCNQSLSSWLENNDAQSARDFKRMKMWFKQIVSAVSYIHQMGVIHRDLKPTNILMAAENTLKICDMGIITESLIKPPCTLYMSPEQIRNRPLDEKTDIFSLGLILLELCVVMKREDRAKVFTEYLKFIHTNNKLIHDSDVAEVVGTLTKCNPKDRPTSSKILELPFLNLL